MKNTKDKNIRDIVNKQDFSIFKSTENDARPDFTNEQFYKNFVLGSELQICSEYIKSGFSYFKKFILKNNLNINAFNFFYQIHTSLERAMKIVLVLSLDDYTKMNFKNYSHNLVKLLDDVESLCNFDDKEKKYISSLDGKYLQLRYQNFNKLKSKKESLTSGFHKNELVEWIKSHWCIELECGSVLTWKLDGKEIENKRLNFIVNEHEKTLKKICGKIATYIKIKSDELNIFMNEFGGSFYNRHNI